MRHPCHAHAAASPQPAPADAPADDIADVISLEAWRTRASAATVPTHQARADARSAHPAQLWAQVRAATPS